MPNKKKILFYGNCQAGVIARHFRLNLSDRFDVQLCTDCGLQPFWEEPGLFAVWSPVNKDNQKTYKDCIRSKIYESDIFVFQDHSGLSVIDELKTERLHDMATNSLKVCLPDTRFFAHLTDKKCLEPFIEYVRPKVQSDEELLEYLQKSDDPELVKILKNEYPFSKTFVRYRNENTHRFEQERILYDNRINMCDYMEKKYEHEIFSLSHNHMSENYFVELIYRLYSLLDIQISEYPIINLKVPGVNLSEKVDPKQFNFFRKTFSNLK